jgi:tRNA modification GTPase
MDTIFALATARGRSGVAVIRVSGPQAFQAASGLVGDCRLRVRPA